MAVDLTILALLAVHFLGDFPLQGILPGNVAIEKSRNWKKLLLHTSTYSALFLLIFGWKFGVITFVVHTLTDAVTSRLTTRYWYMPVAAIRDDDVAYKRWNYLLEMKWTHFTRLDYEKRPWFWILIGLDQLLHAAQLILTLRLLS